ncbi:hypothetical protein NIES4071_78800 [Calothrix sp. NIES-4071]|nr:hypothetical protein NIES4071_78800 [Calothrix sp. NIES-4071]BAZ62152.1 hypothetical protein NIES4105_78730 [Calothrix sp. NIES-4105]
MAVKLITQYLSTSYSAPLFLSFNIFLNRSIIFWISPCGPCLRKPKLVGSFTNTSPLAEELIQERYRESQL